MHIHCTCSDFHERTKYQFFLIWDISHHLNVRELRFYVLRVCLLENRLANTLCQKSDHDYNISLSTLGFLSGLPLWVYMAFLLFCIVSRAQ